MADPVLEVITMVNASSQTAVARELGVTPSHINDVINRRRGPGKKLLRALGMQRHVVYVKLESSRV